jgi:pyruvate dehydrogenase (quinone)/pyruvate oxidase
MPAKVKKHQVTHLVEALRAGTPNRNRIALQMVKDLLDESSFEASPGHVIPRPVARAMSGVAGRMRDRADAKHP